MPGPSRSRVVVFPDKRVEGLNDVKDREQTLAVEHFDLADAFTREWSTDAHFACYLVEPFDETDAVYRINQAALPSLTAVGGAPVNYLAAADYDNPGHAPWNVETWRDFEGLLRGLEGTKAGERLRQAFASYPTRKGWRWVWRFEHGHHCLDVAPILRGLLGELRAAGLLVDELYDWNRCFRLPHVMRDGIRTMMDPYWVPPEIHADRFLDESTLVPIGKPDSTPHGSTSRTVPDLQDVRSLLKDGTSQKASFFCREMKKLMVGQPSYGPIFELSAVILPPGKEDKDLYALVRHWNMSAAGYAVKVPGATPQHLFALFVGMAEQLTEADKSTGKTRTEDWFSRIWRLSQGAWNKVWPEAAAILKKETEEKALIEAEVKAAEVAALEGADRIIAGVRQWHPGLPTEKTKAWEWIKHRMILRARRGHYHIMNADGWYSTSTTEADGLIPFIKSRRMDPHVSLWRQGREGFRPVRREELLAEHAWAVETVEMNPSAENGGYLANPDKDEGLRLVVPPFRRRRDLVPEFHQGVHDWLMVLGGRRGEKLCVHLGCFLAFERGAVAAMLFILAPGAGKKLLMHGLLECMETNDHASSDHLTGNFNISLVTSPFLFMNEGVSSDRYAHNHLSDMVRRVVTGDFFKAEGKGKDSFMAKTSIRMGIFANSDRILDGFGDGRELSAHDREALGLRMVHYDEPTDRAAEFLKHKNAEAVAATGEIWTKGWIEGDGGEPSRFIVAKHLLWLYEQHGKGAVVGNRLLVEGEKDQAFIRRLRSFGGSGPVVVEALSMILARQGPDAVMDGSRGILVRDGRLFVTTGAILNFWRENLTRGSAERLTMKKVTAALRGIMVGEDKVRSIDGQKERWKEIDVEHLYAEAKEAGWDGARLETLAAGWAEARARAARAEEAQLHSHGNGNGNVHAHVPPSVDRPPPPALALLEGSPC